MNRFQFSVRGLLALVALVAVGCAALFNASPVWASVVFTAATTLLLTAVVAALCRRGRARAFWLGFAVVGWGYFWLATMEIAYFSNCETVWGFDVPSPPVATTRLVHWTYVKLFPSAPDELPSPMRGPIVVGTLDWIVADPGDDGEAEDSDGSPSETPEADYPPIAAFLSIGESFWVLLWAYCGARLGSYCHLQRQPER